MSRDTDPRIVIARRTALLHRLDDEGVPLELANSWIDAWGASVSSRGLDPGGAAYWVAAHSWITTQRGKGREPGWSG